MADKPSRALAVYGDGLARFVNPSHTHLHLHSLASKASCGFLRLPNAPSSESEDERIVREFAILLDACVAYLNWKGVAANDECQNKSLIPTISERFMGMKAAVITSNSSLESFGAELGLTVLESKHFTKNTENSFVASELLKLLGFQEGKTLDTSQFDLVFVRIGAGEDNSVANDLECINSLVGDVMKLAKPGSKALLSNANRSMAICCDPQGHDGDISFKDFKERGGNLVTPADRFLHEVAFKHWKAPKYGALDGNF